MADNGYETLTVVGRHVPSDWDGVGPNPHDTPNPVTGFYEVGVLVQGVFKSLASFKASGLFADIERAKQASESAAAAPSAPTQPTQQRAKQASESAAAAPSAPTQPTQ